jgi:uncharacterized protein
MYESQAGNQLAENQGMTVALFTIKGDNVKFSFRGMDGHSPSALELARALKGGGHKNAAGAEISLHEFIGLIINPS